jgi:hypothetical protein
MSESATEIEHLFNEAFAHWGIVLPEGSIAQRLRGEIRERGWWIEFLFGQDGRGEYLDYYASHRMTDDRHLRIYSDGGIERLPSYACWRRGSADPEEDARLEAEYREANRTVGELLRAKGFRSPRRHRSTKQQI